MEDIVNKLKDYCKEILSIPDGLISSDAKNIVRYIKVTLEG